MLDNVKHLSTGFVHSLGSLHPLHRGGMRSLDSKEGAKKSKKGVYRDVNQKRKFQVCVIPPKEQYRQTCNNGQGEG